MVSKAEHLYFTLDFFLPFFRNFGHFRDSFFVFFWSIFSTKKIDCVRDSYIVIEGLFLNFLIVLHILTQNLSIHLSRQPLRLYGSTSQIIYFLFICIIISLGYLFIKTYISPMQSLNTFLKQTRQNKASWNCCRKFT